jgi:shikimate kinase
VNSIILIGYRCSGKTAVGRELGRRLKILFRDTDSMVRERTGRTVAELVAAGGWSLFRSEERKALADLEGSESVVVATGGGIVESAENRDRLKHMGTVIWLSASPEEIEKRMRQDAKTGDQRPALSREGRLGEIRAMLRRRNPLYCETAAYMIDTSGMAVEAVVDTILRLREEAGRK